MKLHPIFKACCRKHHPIYALDKPFRCGDYIYATDGSICVRCPAGRLGVAEVSATPNPGELNWSRHIWAQRPIVFHRAKPQGPRSIAVPGQAHGIRRRYLRLLQRYRARIYVAVKGLHPMYFELPGTDVDGLVMPMVWKERAR